MEEIRVALPASVVNARLIVEKIPRFRGEIGLNLNDCNKTCLSFAVVSMQMFIAKVSASEARSSFTGEARRLCAALAGRAVDFASVGAPPPCPYLYSLSRLYGVRSAALPGLTAETCLTGDYSLGVASQRLRSSSCLFLLLSHASK